VTGADSEGWTCLGCGVGYIGRRPADSTCPSCVVVAMTTEAEIGNAVTDFETPAGPFETADEARELPGVRAIYETMPPGGRLADGAHRLLCQALDAAGVSLGAYDHALTAWMAGFEPQVVAVIASWVARAAAAVPGLVTLDGGQAATVLGALAVAAECQGARVASCPDGPCSACASRLHLAGEYDAVAEHIRAISAGAATQ
jgi:hypothetical protein